MNTIDDMRNEMDFYDQYNEFEYHRHNPNAVN